MLVRHQPILGGPVTSGGGREAAPGSALEPRAYSTGISRYTALRSIP